MMYEREKETGRDMFQERDRDRERERERERQRKRKRERETDSKKREKRENLKVVASHKVWRPRVVKGLPEHTKRAFIHTVACICRRNINMAKMSVDVTKI